MGFKYDLNRFLAERAGQVPVADLTAILKSGKFHPSVQKRLEDNEKGPENGPDSEACRADSAYREQFREKVLKTMDRLKLDAFVYPTVEGLDFARLTLTDSVHPPPRFAAPNNLRSARRVFLRS
jgi:hypothetical protein